MDQESISEKDLSDSDAKRDSEIVRAVDVDEVFCRFLTKGRKTKARQLF